MVQEEDVMLKAYRYRIYPTKQQDAQMRSHLWLSKQLWNEMLAHTKMMYKEYGRFATKRSLREMVKRQGLYSQVAQELVDRLLDAIDRYFHLKALGIVIGFPRFKSFHRMKSLQYPQSGFKLEGRNLSVTPFGPIKVRLHRAVEGRIKTLSLKLEASGRWFAIFVTEQPLKPFVPNNGPPAGLDLGLRSFAVLSDGTRIANPRHLKKHECKLKRLQR
ncbi:MAG: transposase, partial [Candidatus Verstraetearchaeota archaeon]|nr:transposase [Candidatus Verstraetearchaeota archaeon]